MKNVILPTDFSDNSWKAMCYAAQLYVDKPTVFHLMHTYSVPYSQIEAGVVPNIDSLRQESHDGLNEMLARFQELDHHDQSEFVLESKYATLATAITSMENEHNGDSIIVMGTRGATGFGELFLGTMTTHVIGNSKSSLIVVPNNAKLERPKKIMLAVDKDGIDHKSDIDILIEIAKMHASEVHIVHVPTDSNNLLESGGREKLAIDQYLKDIEHAYHTIDGTYKEDLLTGFAESNDIGLIAMVKKDRGFWGNLFHRSLTKSMTFHCDIPIIILKE